MTKITVSGNYFVIISARMVDFFLGAQNAVFWVGPRGGQKIYVEKVGWTCGHLLEWIRNARLFIILFVRNFLRVCSQFWLCVRNSVEVLLIEIQEKIHHLAGWEGGGQGAQKL